MKDVSFGRLRSKREAIYKYCVVCLVIALFLRGVGAGCRRLPGWFVTSAQNCLYDGGSKGIWAINGQITARFYKCASPASLILKDRTHIESQGGRTVVMERFPLQFTHTGSYQAILTSYVPTYIDLLKMANDNIRLLIPLSSPHLATVLLTPNKA